MELNQLSNPEFCIITRLIGALYYYRPVDYKTYHIQEALEANSTELDELSELLSLFRHADPEALQLEHDYLFSGVGDMPAPPWGSVYLDKEQVVFGDSMLEYRHFLKQHGLSFDQSQTEPEDHIGLMLMVLSMMLEQENDEAIRALLQTHLMTWFPLYQTRLESATTNDCYLGLVKFTTRLLHELCARYAVSMA